MNEWMNDWLNGADGPLTRAPWVCVWRWMQRPGVSGWGMNMLSVELLFPGVWQVTLCFALSFYCSHTCFSTNAPFNCAHSDLTKQSMLVFTSPWSLLFSEEHVFIYHLPSLDFHVCMISLTKPPVVFFFALLTRSLLCLFPHMNDGSTAAAE